MTAREFVSKLKKVSAIQWTGDNLDEVREWLGEEWSCTTAISPVLRPALVITRSNGWRLLAEATDYLVRDERGVVRRVTAEAMAREYEEVEA